MKIAGGKEGVLEMNIKLDLRVEKNKGLENPRGDTGPLVCSLLQC